MTSGPIHSKDKENKKVKKRRALRKVLPPPSKSSRLDQDSGEVASGHSGTEYETSDVLKIDELFPFGNSLFVRCPVLECDFKQLQNDKQYNSEILVRV